MQRLFIAINLPKGVKEKIEKITQELRDFYGFDMKWVAPENWHLTMSFLGWQPDQAIDGIISAIKGVADGFPAPIVELEKIMLVPNAENPRMIWVSGAEKSSNALGDLKDDLENILLDNNVRFKIERRKFNAHINLARMKSEEKSDLDIEELQKMIDEANSKFKKHLPLSFEAESLDLMESHTGKGGAEYIVLSEFKFKQYL